MLFHIVSTRKARVSEVMLCDLIPLFVDAGNGCAVVDQESNTLVLPALHFVFYCEPVDVAVELRASPSSREGASFESSAPALFGSI